MHGSMVTLCFLEGDKLHGAGATVDGSVIDVARQVCHYATLLHVVLVAHHTNVAEMIKIMSVN